MIFTELNKFFFKREKLNLNLEKPFSLKITTLFCPLAFFEWTFFILFWILSVAGGIISPIVMAIEGEVEFYFVPVFAVFWIGLMWLFFYVWCWFCLGSNYPKRVTVDETGARIEYPIRVFNHSIPKERLQVGPAKILGVPMIKIKDKKKIKGIFLNEYIYRTIK